MNKDTQYAYNTIRKLNISVQEVKKSVKSLERKLKEGK